MASNPRQLSEEILKYESPEKIEKLKKDSSFDVANPQEAKESYNDFLKEVNNEQSQDLMLYGYPANEDYLKAQWTLYKDNPNDYEKVQNPDVYSVVRRYGAKVEPDHPIHKRPLLPF